MTNRERYDDLLNLFDVEMMAAEQAADAGHPERADIHIRRAEAAEAAAEHLKRAVEASGAAVVAWGWESVWGG